MAQMTYHGGEFEGRFSQSLIANDRVRPVEHPVTLSVPDRIDAHRQESGLT